MPASIKKLKLVFINMDMGASEADIAEKVTNKFKVFYPEIQIESEQHFYTGIERTGDAHDDYLLQSFGVNIKPISQLEADIKRFESIPEQQDTVTVKILMSQTTDCGKYSQASNKIAHSKKLENKQKQEKHEAKYFENFVRSLGWKPDIVLCENVHSIAKKGQDFLASLNKAITNTGLSVFDTSIEHNRVTATKRRRHYTIGSQFQISWQTIEEALPPKLRLPEKYLFQLPSSPQKYNEIKMLESNTPTTGKGIFYAGMSNFIKSVKLHLAFQPDNMFLIVLPNKIKEEFTRKSGKARRDKPLSRGLEITINNQGTIHFYKDTGVLYERLTLIHSKSHTPTLTADALVKFWDHETLNPSIGSVAKMQGVSKKYVKNFLEAKIPQTYQKKILSHNLSPAVVSPILTHLIQLQVFGNVKKTPATNGQLIPDTPVLQDLCSGINPQNYKFHQFLLADGKNYLYFLVDDKGFVDLGMVFSSVPLAKLYSEGLLDQNVLQVFLDALILKNNDQGDCEEEVMEAGITAESAQPITNQDNNSSELDGAQKISPREKWKNFIATTAFIDPRTPTLTKTQAVTKPLSEKPVDKQSDKALSNQHQHLNKKNNELEEQLNPNKKLGISSHPVLVKQTHRTPRTEARNSWKQFITTTPFFAPGASKKYSALNTTPIIQPKLVQTPTSLEQPMDKKSDDALQNQHLEKGNNKLEQQLKKKLTVFSPSVPIKRKEEGLEPLASPAKKQCLNSELMEIEEQIFPGGKTSL